MKALITLKLVLIVLFVAGLVLMALTPSQLRFFMGFTGDIYRSDPSYSVFVLAFLLTVGALGLWIVGELIWMLQTASSDPFVMRNARALRRIGCLALLVAALFFAKCVVFITPLTLLFALVMVVLSLFALTLSYLFRQAVLYKEENELTI